MNVLGSQNLACLFLFKVNTQIYEIMASVQKVVTYVELCEESKNPFPKDKECRDCKNCKL